VIEHTRFGATRLFARQALPREVIGFEALTKRFEIFRHAIDTRAEFQDRFGWRRTGYGGLSRRLVEESLERAACEPSGAIQCSKQHAGRVPPGRLSAQHLARDTPRQERRSLPRCWS
jgi:hypothetical protein